MAKAKARAAISSDQEILTEDKPPVNSAWCLTDREATAFLNLSRKTLYFWRRAKKGPPYVRYGERAIRYLRSDLEAWQMSQRVVPENAPPLKHGALRRVG